MAPKRTTQNSVDGRNAEEPPQENPPEPRNETSTIPTEGTTKNPHNNSHGDSETTRTAEPLRSETLQHTSEQRQQGNLDNAPVSEIETALEKARQDEIRLAKLEELREVEQRSAARLARIEQLSSQGTSTPAASTPAPASEVETPIRAHTTSAAGTSSRNADSDKNAPAVANIKSFQATNHKEYEGFLNKLEVHFELHEKFFRDNERAQVATGASLLGNELLSRWRREGKTHPNRTWEDFKDFCEKETTDPKVQRRNAALAYSKMEQREHQSVSEFSNHLEALEDQMKVAYTDEQKKTHLYAKLWSSVRRQAQQTAGEPNSYNEYISWLRACEDNVPGRAAVLSTAKQNRSATANKKDKPAPASRDHPKGTWNNHKRKREFNDNDKRPICWKCKRGRHPANECRSAPWRKDLDKSKN